MATDIKIPEIGESVSEVQISEWLKEEGDTVEKDENIVTLESDKATVDLPSPASGRLKKIMTGKGESASVGDVIGQLEEGEGGGEAPSGKSKKNESKKKKEEEESAKKEEEEETEEETPDQETEARDKEETQQKGKQTSKKETKKAAQRGRRKAKDEESGDTKEEEPKEEEKASREEKPAGEGEEKEREEEEAHEVRAEKGERDTGRPEPDVQPMSVLRRTVANRLVEAQRAMAILSTFNEIDMSEVIRLRQDYRDAFQEKHGVKLGFMSFFVKAAIAALKEVPRLNAEVRENNIVQHRCYDIGVAIGSGKGLVVPPLRDADGMSFGEVEKTIADLARRARENRLMPDELQGGTFTISNGGIYGSLLSTPIINPPQSGILGLHSIQDRPVAVEGQVVIRPMMYVALSYDHRIVDGREAVTFLRRVKEFMESPSRLLVEA